MHIQYTVRNGHGKLFLYGITHVMKWKSSEKYVEKVALQILLSFPCNLMDNFDWDFFLYFHRFFHRIFFSMEFSMAFYGKCTNLHDGQHRIFYLIPVLGAFSI
jgi:hypothetical protein